MKKRSYLYILLGSSISHFKIKPIFILGQFKTSPILRKNIRPDRQYECYPVSKRIEEWK